MSSGELPISGWPDQTAQPTPTQAYLGADNLDTAVSERMSYADAQRFLRYLQPNVATLAGIDVTALPDGLWAATSGHTIANIGGTMYRLDKTTSPQPTANNGTVLGASGDPNARWISRALDGATEFDIRHWGGRLGKDASFAAGNDQAIADMILAKVPGVMLRGPFAYSKTITLTGQPFFFLGTTPYAADAGGLLAVGNDTATTQAMVELINGADHHFFNLRWYGHIDSATGTRVANGLKLTYNSTLGSEHHQTRCRVFNNRFSAAQRSIRGFDNCFWTNFTNLEGGTDLILIDHTLFENWAEKAVYLQNGQSTGSEFYHCTFDGTTSTTFSDFAQHAFFLRANCNIRNCYINRCQTAMEVNQGVQVLVDSMLTEHCRLNVNVTNGNARVVMKHGKFQWHDDAYANPGGNPDQHTVRARNKLFVLEDWLFEDSLSTSPRPNLFIGNGTAALRGAHRFIDVEGITLDDFKADVPVGRPSQRERRLAENLQGMWFEWKPLREIDHINEWIGIGDLNLG